MLLSRIIKGIEKYANTRVRLTFLMIRYSTIKKGSSLIITVALWKYTVLAILLISLIEASLLLRFEG